MIFSYNQNYYWHFKRIAKQQPSTAVTEEIINYPFLNKSQNPLFWIGRFMRTENPVDRTGHLNLINSDIIPIPKIDKSFNKSFEEICYSTAVNYWKTNSDITVLWSGGLDSTCVAISFLDTKPFDKKITLLGTQESIDEYPGFYESHKSIIQIENTENFWKKLELLQNKTSYVTGDIGDQIFGGRIDEYPDQKNDDWETFIDWDDPFALENSPYFYHTTIEILNKFLLFILDLNSDINELKSP